MIDSEKTLCSYQQTKIISAVNVDVHVSKQFLGWVFSLGEQVKILSPEEVVEQMQGEVKRLVEQYDSRVKV